MKLLRNLVEIDDITADSEYPDALPPATIDQIQKSIRDGVKPDKDTGQFQKWANALHLVHKAYQVNNIQRPVPTMKGAWKQYEENIEYAVSQLAKTQGLKADWRLSSSVFHEAFELAKGNGFEVEVIDDGSVSTFLVSAEGAKDVITSLKETATLDGYKVKILQEDDKQTVTFWRNNVKKKGFAVTIRS